MKRTATLLTLLALLSCLVHGADKSSYTLFSPTPRDQMRELSADRPDATESAYTVDAGHVQIEATLFGFGKDTPSARRTSKSASRTVRTCSS
jgi:hypothetical protein